MHTCTWSALMPIIINFNFLYLDNKKILELCIMPWFLICLWLAILCVWFGHLLDESDKKSTSWVQDCLSRGKCWKTKPCYYIEFRWHLLTIIVLIMFCRISEDFSLLIIIHSMRDSATETRMNLVTGRLESQREKYSLLTLRYAF